ncbi:MAG: NAD(+)/NADH kinase [Planctomycetaceae bacterium]|nr:NAD(+)/NADH kinase [Planctomycetaceae bacterium]
MKEPDLRIIVLTGGDRPDIRAAWEDLRVWLETVRGVIVVGVFSGNEPIPEDLAGEIVVVLGGDGSVLRGCRQLGRRQLPIVGVNLGRLGFLTDLSPAEFRKGLAGLKRGQYQTVEHLMFECNHYKADGSVITDLGLNEVNLTSAGSMKMLSINLRIDNADVTTYSCDGLIISTPVGSTAHNLSAGGPILRQELQCFVITPICPHTLTVRPIVDSAERTFELSVRNAPPGVMLVIDGQISRPVDSTDRILIRRAEQTFKLVRLAGHSFYGTLHRKLGWQGHLDYRERRGGH